MAFPNFNNFVVKASLALLLIIIVISDGVSQDDDNTSRKFVFDDLGIYLENLLPGETSPDRYTVDNIAYKIHRKFIFDYFIVRNGDTLKIAAPKISQQNSDFHRDWTFIPLREESAEKVETISITVLPGIANVNQTKVQYDYQYVPDNYSTYSSTSGVIENEMNTWIHPHRDKYFMILELNPFPYIQRPFKKGNKWKWTLAIGPHWQDRRWKMWAGPIRNEYQYEIVGKEKLETSSGSMDCWVVRSTATSSIGSTHLLAYYSEENGFVKLDYTNIDNSKTVIEIKEIRPATVSFDILKR
jgi:hypothetical protein